VGNVREGGRWCLRGMVRGRWKLLQTSIVMVLERLADDLKGFQISAVLYYQAMSLMCFPYLAAFIFAGLFFWSSRLAWFDRF
jgi:hypothetical protein